MLKIDVKGLEASCDIKGPVREYIKESATAVIVLINALAKNLEISPGEAEGILMEVTHTIQKASGTVMVDMNALKGKEK